MEQKQFFKRIGKDKEFFAGFILIDIVGHSKLGQYYDSGDVGKTIAALKSLVCSQLHQEFATVLTWEGDGGIVVFKVSDDCEPLVMFADRIRHLLPLFNRARGTLNPLPDGQDISVRIICSAGNAHNTGAAETLACDALNHLKHHAKEVEHRNYVVITGPLFERLKDDIQRRFSKWHEHEKLGMTYVLDYDLTITSIHYHEDQIAQLEKWIQDAVDRYKNKYQELLYFGYTNQRLKKFAFRLQGEGINVRALARNWLVERREEEAFNNCQFPQCKPSPSGEVKRWENSQLIKESAVQLQASGQFVSIRFYDGPPTFVGAILWGPERSCGRIGVCKWIQLPEGGGSQYKLEQWPALRLEGRDAIQSTMLEYFRSRFEEMWAQSRTYEQVLKDETALADNDPSVVGQIWDLSGKPYLIVCPHWRIPGRRGPLVALEDAMAVVAVVDFLKGQRVRTQVRPLRGPVDQASEVIQAEVRREIEAWRGNVVYVCFWSISQHLQRDLDKNGFPWKLGHDANDEPFLWHRKKPRCRLTSPTKPGDYQDYALVGKFRRNDRNEMGYVVAGLHAPGTWGAATYLTSSQGIRELAERIQDTQFAAVVVSELDTKRNELNLPKLHSTGAESFIGDHDAGIIQK